MQVSVQDVHVVQCSYILLSDSLVKMTINYNSMDTVYVWAACAAWHIHCIQEEVAKWMPSQLVRHISMFISTSDLSDVHYFLH